MLDSSEDAPSTPPLPPGPTSVSMGRNWSLLSKSEPVVSGWQEATRLLQSQPVQDGSDLLCCPGNDAVRCTHVLEEGRSLPTPTAWPLRRVPLCSAACSALRAWGTAPSPCWASVSLSIKEKSEK